MDRKPDYHVLVRDSDGSPVRLGSAWLLNGNSIRIRFDGPITWRQQDIVLAKVPPDEKKGDDDG